MPDIVDRRDDNGLASHQDIGKVGHEVGRDRAERFLHETSGTVALNGFSYLAGRSKTHHMRKGGRYKNHDQRTMISLRVVEGLLVLSLIHISEPTRLGMISYAVFCLKK